MKVLLAALLCAFSFWSWGATNLDSLYAIWEDDNLSDSIRVKAYDKFISRGFLYSQPDTAFLLAQQIIDLSVKANYPWGEAVGYHIQGISQSITSNYDRALKCFERNLAIWQELDNQIGEASTLSNIGIAYYRQGNYPRTLEYFQRSLEIEEKMGNKSGASTTLSNIGVIYFGLENYKEALKCYKRGLAIAEELEDKKGMGTALVNIGGVYQVQDDYPNALDYYQRSVITYEELGDTLENADALSNIGAIYEKQQDYVKAMHYYKRSTAIFQTMGDDYGMATNSLKMGKLYHDQQNYYEAILWYQKTNQKAKEINSVSIQWEASVGLVNTYKSLSDWRNALAFSEKAQELNDSLKKDETDNQLQQFEFDRKILQDSIAREKEKSAIDLAHQAEMNQKNRIQYAAFGIGSLVLLLAIGLFSRLRYTNRTKKVIEAEKDRSDNLLLNILPAEVAEELKEKGEAQAQHIDQATVLFTDFVGFTQMSEQLGAAELVAELNHCFKEFDGICEKYGIEKIKTIGDAYMAAGGLPIPTTKSANKVVMASLEMNAFITNRKTELENNGQASFQMRTGVHTGPVVAGIVGVKKFQYDIWGDTVNTASRMESHGQAGRVNVSNATYQVLKDQDGFQFEEREELEVKGKGNMKMWFVKGK